MTPALLQNPPPNAGHTLWFIGDSQIWHFYYAAECALRSYTTSLVRRNVTDDVNLVERLRTEAWPRRRPICLLLQNSSRVCAVRYYQSNSASVGGYMDCR